MDGKLSAAASIGQIVARTRTADAVVGAHRPVGTLAPARPATALDISPPGAAPVRHRPSANEVTADDERLPRVRQFLDEHPDMKLAEVDQRLADELGVKPRTVRRLREQLSRMHQAVG
ncbi:hypothetical protein [Krasilnikovia sp. MM14-A1259]|uniref:hypothetical protein n=1 Tax=Krasilnikovia sp. MM14-A1259 TaxID=3373539 RepID=UPI00381022E2